MQTKSISYTPNLAPLFSSGNAHHYFSNELEPGQIIPSQLFEAQSFDDTVHSSFDTPPSFEQILSQVFQNDLSLVNGLLDISVVSNLETNVEQFVNTPISISKATVDGLLHTAKQKKALGAVALLSVAAGLSQFNGAISGVILSILGSNLSIAETLRYKGLFEEGFSALNAILIGYSAVKFLHTLPAAFSTAIAAYSKERLHQERINAIVDWYQIAFPKSNVPLESLPVFQVQKEISEKLHLSYEYIENPSINDTPDAKKITSHKALLLQSIATDLTLIHQIVTTLDEPKTSHNSEQIEMLLTHAVKALYRLRIMLRCFNKYERKALFSFLKNQLHLSRQMEVFEGFTGISLESFYGSKIVIPKLGIAKILQKTQMQENVLSRKIEIIFGGLVLACHQADSIIEMFRLWLPSMIVAGRAQEDGISLQEELLIAYLKDGNISSPDIHGAMDLSFQAESLLKNIDAIYNDGSPLSILALLEQIQKEFFSGKDALTRQMNQTLDANSSQFVLDTTASFKFNRSHILKAAEEEMAMLSLPLIQLAKDYQIDEQLIKNLAALLMIAKKESAATKCINSTIETALAHAMKQAQTLQLDENKLSPFLSQFFSIEKQELLLAIHQDIEIAKKKIEVALKGSEKNSSHLIKQMYSLTMG